jgi:hypothetical protein
MTLQDPKERVLSWRAEIVGELAEAQFAVPPLVTAHETAAAAAQEAAEDYRETQKLLGVLDRLETPLKLRADAHAKELDQAKSAKARALSDLEAAQSKVTQLQRSLYQIDRVIPPAESEEAA